MRHRGYEGGTKEEEEKTEGGGEEEEDRKRGGKEEDGKRRREYRVKRWKEEGSNWAYVGFRLTQSAKACSSAAKWFGLYWA